MPVMQDIIITRLPSSKGSAVSKALELRSALSTWICNMVLAYGVSYVTKYMFRTANMY